MHSSKFPIVKIVDTCMTPLIKTISLLFDPPSYLISGDNEIDGASLNLMV